MVSTSENTSRLIDAWIHSQAGRKVFDSRIISHAIPELSVESLANALIGMVQSGKLAMEYRLVAPVSGVLVGHFNSPDEIPDQFEDRMGNQFETYTVPIVPVFLVK